MKRFLAILVFIISCVSTSKANVNLALDYATFYLVDKDQPYVEFYLSINGNSLYYGTTEEQKKQARVEITYLIEKGEEVVAFEKFRLNSPLYGAEDTFLDLVDLKRLSFPAEEGVEYYYTIIARDLISGKSVEETDKLRKNTFPKDRISISEILISHNVIAASGNSFFEKNGYDIIPSYTHFYGPDQDKLYFYIEVYNSSKSLGKNAQFLMEYSVVSLEDGQVIANLNAFKRMESAAVIPVIQSFGLEDLPTGKYALKVKLKNRENELMTTTSINFHRYNPNLSNYSAVRTENTFVDSLTNKKELVEYIKCLAPISSASELQYAKNQVNYGDIKLMQQYFLNFWKERDVNQPQKAWFDYKQEVDKVNELFGYGNIKGYQTERGRVYLQYGPPSAMQNVPYQRDTYPYSVWQYYNLNGQTNRRFIFYSPSMEMLGYQVLHSNVPGEIQNPNWEFELISRGNPNLNVGAETPEGATIQQEARDLFDNPR
jgi:GWxTD domain-containing protein